MFARNDFPFLKNSKFFEMTGTHDVHFIVLFSETVLPGCFTSSLTSARDCISSLETNKHNYSGDVTNVSFPRHLPLPKSCLW